MHFSKKQLSLPKKYNHQVKLNILIAMQKIFTIFVLLIFVCSGLINCAGYQVNCPEFEEVILSWFPYQESDVIELYSQTKDGAITFSINKVEITHTTHYTTGTDCGTCDDDIVIEGYGSSNLKIVLFLNKNKIISQRYSIDDSNFKSYSQQNNYMLEGNEYDAVRIFNNASNETFNKLILAKGIGIIGLIDVEGNTWKMKNDVKKRLDESDEPEDQKKYVIKNRSC